MAAHVEDAQRGTRQWTLPQARQGLPVSAPGTPHLGTRVARTWHHQMQPKLSARPDMDVSECLANVVRCGWCGGSQLDMLSTEVVSVAEAPALVPA
eukprot:2140368-Rhodomonas_salina.1